MNTVERTRALEAKVGLITLEGSPDPQLNTLLQTSGGGEAPPKKTKISINTTLYYDLFLHTL